MPKLNKTIHVLWILSLLCLACQSETTGERGQFAGGGKADDTYSCEGYCGEKAPGGCWCDEKCDENNDCCADKVAVCDKGGTHELTEDQLLAASVVENIEVIKEVANQKFADQIPENGSVSMQEDGVKCLAWTADSGTCIVYGDTGWPNSDTIFVVTVAKPNFGDCDYETIEYYVEMIDGEC